MNLMNLYVQNGSPAVGHTQPPSANSYFLITILARRIVSKAFLELSTEPAIRRLILMRWPPNSGIDGITFTRISDAQPAVRPSRAIDASAALIHVEADHGFSTLLIEQSTIVFAIGATSPPDTTIVSATVSDCPC